MKKLTTKSLIKQKTLELFNTEGVQNVTLRTVAKDLGKSYGNITYHYKTKEHLLDDLISDLNFDLNKVIKLSLNYSNKLETYFKLSEFNFSVAKKYRFLLVDNIELQRNYPTLFNNKSIQIILQSETLLKVLKELKANNLLQKNLTEAVFNFIIEVIVAITIEYFKSTKQQDLSVKEYVKKIGKILYPYLTDKGKLLYIKY
ncbi:MAG: TetR/AcrR family transcriptional regulator [Flavobacteriaceae bacterium]|nr:TetR/AcrR family transcriptional regulator [Flavobacteriaceae bacterium]